MKLNDDFLGIAQWCWEQSYSTALAFVKNLELSVQVFYFVSHFESYFQTVAANWFYSTFSHSDIMPVGQGEVRNVFFAGVGRFLQGGAGRFVHSGVRRFV